MLRPADVGATLLVAAAALALLLGADGCTERACFKWTQGACPTQADATKFFGACSNVQTVNSPPSAFDGLCCYDVTDTLDGLPCGTPGAGPGPGGGRSIAGSAASAVTGGGTGGTHGIGGAGGSGGVGGNAGMGGAPNCAAEKCGFNPSEPLSGCLACAQASDCASQAEACSDDMDCGAFESCLNGCDLSDQPCINACATGFPEGAALFSSLIDCEVCTVCFNACASSPIQALTNCNEGGTGGTSLQQGLGGAPKF